MNVLKSLGGIAKALLAAAIAAGGSVVTALGDNVISTQEIVTAVLAGLVALGAVYGIPNVSKKGS